MWYAVMGGWWETCSEMSWIGFVEVGYVPRNNSPRMGFSGFFSVLDCPRINTNEEGEYGFITRRVLTT